MSEGPGWVVDPFRSGPGRLLSSGTRRPPPPPGNGSPRPTTTRTDCPARGCRRPTADSVPVGLDSWPSCCRFRRDIGARLNPARAGSGVAATNRTTSAMSLRGGSVNRNRLRIYPQFRRNGGILFASRLAEPLGEEICELFIRDGVSAGIEPLPGERSLEDVYRNSECAAKNGDEGNRAECRAKGVLCQGSKLCRPRSLAVSRPKGVRGLLYELVTHEFSVPLSLGG